MMTDDREALDELGVLFGGLATLSYYEILGVAETGDYVSIRDAYYRRAQRFHPDRFLALADEDLRYAAYSVYKRVTEAYNVLVDPQLRSAYDRARAQGQHRLSDIARSRRLSPEERQLTNPFARLYMRAATTKLRAGQTTAAWIDAKLGLSLEDARVFRLLIDQIEKGKHP